MSYEIFPLDCRLAMRMLMAPNSVDSIVTDPPYDLTSIVKRFGAAGAAPAKHGTDGAFARASRGFMGQQWDGTAVAFDPDTWREAYRVLKPGGYLVAFGGTRTFHRMVCAIEDASFEIRDRIRFECAAETKYGPFWDSLNDEQRAVFVEYINDQVDPMGSEIAWAYGSGFPKSHDAGEGRGTALKPAYEPICIARKPLDGTVAQCLATWGTGAINIDACRVPMYGEIITTGQGTSDQIYGGGKGLRPIELGIQTFTSHELGRFPANVITDGSDAIVSCFPSAPGQIARVSTSDTLRAGQNVYGEMRRGSGGAAPRNDSGSAARFFYCAKASRADRDSGGVPSSHPTVKPVDLMRYLCRLVTPPGGLVFDPFTGSGSTGKAALLEGFRFVGCEMTPEYVPIAEARCANAAAQRAARPEPARPPSR